jgi:hypothetical protein
MACAVLSKKFSPLRGHHEELGVVEPFWEAQLAVLVTVVLYVALPTRLTVGPRWLVPSLEGVLLFGLVISTPYLHHTQSPIRRRISIGLIAVVTAANFTAEGLLVHYLLRSGSPTRAWKTRERNVGGDPPIPSRSPVGPTVLGRPVSGFPYSGTCWKWRSSSMQ